MLSARALAVIAGRDYVLPEDVKAVATAVLGHRITVKPELWMTERLGCLRRGLAARLGADPVGPRARAVALRR